MSAAEIGWLIGAGVLAGIVSVVASLASLVSYPALLAIGLPPLSANVTNTVALVFTSLGSAAGSRPELAGQRHTVRKLSWLTAAGGALGAAILLLTPASAFERAVPVLVAGASILLLARRRPASPIPAAAVPARVRRPETAGRVAQVGVFVVAAYTGYFGAAGGVLMLAVLATFLDGPMARTIAVKNVIAGFANGFAALGFIAFGPVRWAAAAPLAAGFLLGGWLGPGVVRRLPGEALRIGVGIAGLAVAVKLGYSAYF